MSRSTLSVLLALAATSKFALAQPDPADPTPLVDKTYAYPSGIPYQVDYNTAAIRGPQTGYNICNSTTENQNSLCQTSMVNHIDDFCLWAPATPNSTIADTEQSEVAWCTKPGHGTRLIPNGALQGVQMLRTSEYIQITGFIDQTQVNMNAQDYGGELDPHGADLRGNPLGGLMYSNAFPSNGGNNNTYQQVIDWTNFMGGNAFCITICDPASSSANQSAYCQNIYDRMGCSYNMPSNGQNGTFEVCDADLKTPVGIYVTGGVTMTYSQPATAAVVPPYTAVVPASSNCVSYTSSVLYAAIATVTPTGVSASATATGSGTGSVKSSTGTGTAGAASSTQTGGAITLGVSTLAGLTGTLFAIVFLS
ncbi:hypothetical protein DFH29DRAFT_933391 [Suillus ampliporus]|nr:hypothetical protein DFH29DRAFT_933391 [Suillus ampliporus]